jgi:hypothetical protein
LHLALREGWRIEQANIVAAYLNAYLKHEVYVKDPAVTGSKVWKLYKALYGLNQSAHEWNTEITGILAQAELHPLKTDPACYIGSGILIASYVDDCLITTSVKIDCLGFLEEIVRRIYVTFGGRRRKSRRNVKVFKSNNCLILQRKKGEKNIQRKIYIVNTN